MDDGSGFNKEGHFRTHTTTTVQILCMNPQLELDPNRLFVLDRSLQGHCSWRDMAQNAPNG